MRHLRLVPAAIVAWICGWAVVVLAPASVTPARIGGGIAVIAGVVMLASRRVGLLASSALCLASGSVLLTASLYAASITLGPVAEAGASAQRVTAEVVVGGDLRVRDGVYEQRATVESITTSRGTWRVSAPVLLRTRGEAPTMGVTLRVTARAGPGDAQRGYAAALAVDTQVALSGPGPMATLANAVRGGLRQALDGAEPRAAALVEGLAVGEESAQPPGLADDMRASGLSHLTAVSGGNTAIVVGAVLIAAAALRIRLIGRVLAALAALAVFVVIVGPQPSVLRAAAMGVVALAAMISGGRRRGIAALAGCVVVLLAWSPGLAVSWGFALSVAATAGLLVLAPAVLARLRGTGDVRRHVAEALAMTVAAQVATLPLIAAFGQGISLVAVPANLLAAPAVVPVTVLGLLAALMSPISPPIAHVLARGAEPPAAWIAAVAERSASVPGATLPWPGGLAGAALALIVAGVLIWVIRRRRGRHERAFQARVIALITAVVAVVATVALRLPDRAGWPPDNWVMVACDVGQGDAIVLRAGDGDAVVIDAGPEPALIDRCLSDLGVARVPLLVLTHPHADHIDGVPGVLRGRTVSEVIVSPLREPVEQAVKVDEWFAGMSVRIARAGERRMVQDIALTILWPQRIIRGPESAPNNASVGLLAEVSGVRILLLGDVETSAQVALRSSVGLQGVDVVKVPHHGSRYQDPALANWTGGRVAVFTVGAGNRYGHPAPETLDQWRYAGAVIARTDLAGDIAIVTTPHVAVVTRR